MPGGPKPLQGLQSTSLERYRRLVPYMTYYVAQGLAQRPSGLSPLQPIHNGIDSYNTPSRLRGSNGYQVPTYVVRPAPVHGAPPRPHSGAASQTPAAAQPPRTLFRFDFQQRPNKAREQPFLPSPPLTPENKDSDDYFKPVTDATIYYRTAPAATPAPALQGPQDQHLVVFPEDDSRLRAKLRQQQRKQQQQQLLLQQQNQQQLLLDESYRLKLLLLQQQQLQQAKEVRAQLQAQRLREQLRAQQQQDLEVRKLVQAQQANQRIREQQLQAQQQAQQQAQLQQQHQQAQDLKDLREHRLQAHLRAQEYKKLRAQQIRLQQDQEMLAQLQAQEELRVLQAQQVKHKDEMRAQIQQQAQQEDWRAQIQQQAQQEDWRAHIQQQAQQEDMRAQIQQQAQQEDLRAQIQQQAQQEDLRAQIQQQAQQEDLRAQIQQQAQQEDLRAQIQQQAQQEDLRAQIQQQAQQEDLRAQIQQERNLQRQQTRAQAQGQRPQHVIRPVQAPSSGPDTEVEQQVVVSLEEVEKMMLPPSASDSASAPAPTSAATPNENEVVVEPDVQQSASPPPIPVHIKPVVYAEDAEINPTVQNVAPPSSSRDLVAHLINGLQLSNKLPQSLTPDNFDMSLKTILQLLKILHKSKASNGSVAPPAKVKVSPEAPETDTGFYIGGGTVSQTFPAPSVEGSTPGKPGIDYPAYDSIPKTSFSCSTQRYKGFFGDPETNCQVWHYCDLNGGQASFLCPNGTIFSQVGLTCDWWFNVRCASTAQLYVLNERLYKYILPVKPSFPEDYSGPDVDRYLTEKFREMQAKARGRKEKLKAKENDSSPASPDSTAHPEEPLETNQTEEQEKNANKAPAIPHVKEDVKQQLDPDL